MTKAEDMAAALAAAGCPADLKTAARVIAALVALPTRPRRKPQRSQTGRHHEVHVDESRYAPVLTALRAGKTVSSLDWAKRGFPRITAFVERLRWHGWNILTVQGTGGAAYRLDPNEPFRAGWDFRPMRGGFFRTAATTACGPA